MKKVGRDLDREDEEEKKERIHGETAADRLSYRTLRVKFHLGSQWAEPQS